VTRSLNPSKGFGVNNKEWGIRQKSGVKNNGWGEWEGRNFKFLAPEGRKRKLFYSMFMWNN